MINFYIQMRDGQPYQHPILEQNMREAFPDVDLDNLPDSFCYFVRVNRPDLGPYEKNQTCSYVPVEGSLKTYTDEWSCENMTAEEITAKQNAVKAAWVQNGYPSWTFNEATCAFEPPTPMPTETEGQHYVWDEEALSWFVVGE